MIGHWTVISGIVVTAELNRRNDNQAKSGHSWYWGGDTFGADWVIVALELDQTNQHYHQIFDERNKGMVINIIINVFINKTKAWLVINIVIKMFMNKTKAWMILATYHQSFDKQTKTL